MAMLNQELELDKFKDSILTESTILYVGNNKEEQTEALDILNKVFNKVIVANNSSKALELFQQNQINLILIDIEMPNSDGITFMQSIRKINWSIPIFIIVDVNNLSILPQVTKLKVSDYLFKPVLYITAIKLFMSTLEQISHLQILEKQQQELTQFKSILNDQTLVSETDLSGKIIYANHLFCEVSGYSNDELVGQPHNIVRHPDISPKIYEDLWKTIQSGNVWMGKIKNRAKDGSEYFVKATIFPIYDSKGEIIKYMAIRYLITDEEHEKQKLKKYIMSQRSEKIKNDQNYKKNIKKDVEAAVLKNNYANIQKIDQLNKVLKETQDELHRLRTVKEHASRKVISLEKEAKAKDEKLQKLQGAYQEKIEKLYATTKTAYEQYEVVKKKNDGFNERYRKAQEAIKQMQSHIDEYRKKIGNLEDVIKSLETDIVELKESSSSSSTN